MSKVSNLIFGGAKHTVSSPYGNRKQIHTSAGGTSSFHSGTDYATYGKKLPQYAIAEGAILSCGTAADGAKYVWVSYPSLNVKMLHYHLDRFVVCSGQSVKKGTLLGYTGMTGKATGIHLHLGIKSLSGGSFIDPEAWSENEYEKLTKPKYSPGNYKVNTSVLNVRVGPGTKYKVKPFTKLTKSAQSKIKKISGKAVNGYVKGLTFTCYEVKPDGKYVWGRTPSGWVALDYCERV